MSEENHAHFRKQAERDHEAKKRHHMAGGGDVAQSKKLIKTAIDEHDEQLHGGKKTRLKFKDGGKVEGEGRRERLDRANGGRTKKAGHKTNINIVMPQGQDRPVPVPVGGPMGAGAPPPRPPMMPPPGAGGPPPGMPPMGPPAGAGVPMPHKDGGRVKKAYGGPMDGGAMMPPQAMPAGMSPQPMGAYKRGGKIEQAAGSGNGLGRLAKMKEYGDMKPNTENEPFVEPHENEKRARGGRR